MTLQNLANKMGIMVWSDNNLSTLSGISSTQLNAVGEYRFYVGRVFLEAGSGSKTISSAGGKILWRNGGNATFADAGTTVRVGIQDVGGDGFPDATFDVYADLVGGTDTIAANTDYFTPMESGSKTITHGDLVAIGLHMTARGGTDIISPGGYAPTFHQRVTSNTTGFPYIVRNIGTPTRTSTGDSGCAIEFDDGSLGWISGQPYAPNIGTDFNLAFNNGSTPDEYAAVFQVPFKCAVTGGFVAVDDVASTDPFEIILYSDPTGSPSVIETITVDADQIGANIGYYFTFLTTRTLDINTNYAIAVRPTSANSIGLHYFNFLSGNDRYKKLFPFGTTAYLMARSDQTGAFSSVQDYYMPLFGLMIGKLDDGESSGGGGGNGFFIQ